MCQRAVLFPPRSLSSLLSSLDQPYFGTYMDRTARCPKYVRGGIHCIGRLTFGFVGKRERASCFALARSSWYTYYEAPYLFSRAVPAIFPLCLHSFWVLLGRPSGGDETALNDYVCVPVSRSCYLKSRTIVPGKQTTPSAI